MTGNNDTDTGGRVSQSRSRVCASRGQAMKPHEPDEGGREESLNGYNNISNQSFVFTSCSVIAVDTIWTLNDTDWNHPAHTLPQTPPRYGLLTYNYVPCNESHDVE